MLQEASVENDSALAVDALSITVLICTHNRRALLERTIGSLNAVRRPRDTAESLPSSRTGDAA